MQKRRGGVTTDIAFGNGNGSTNGIEQQHPRSKRLAEEGGKERERADYTVL